MIHSYQNYFSKEGLGLILNCPICFSPYSPLDIELIEDSEKAHLLHLSCHKCGSQILALITNNMSQVFSQGLVTELTSNEVRKFKDSPAVSLDDVIDLHFLLNNKKVSFLY